MVSFFGDYLVSIYLGCKRRQEIELDRTKLGLLNIQVSLDQHNKV